MPAAIPLLAGGLASGLAGGGFLGAIIGGVVTFGLNQVLGPKAPDFNFQDRARGLSANVSNPVAPLAVIYGSTRFAGDLVYAGVSGTENEYLDLIVAWGEGEISAINTIYLDDLASTDGRFAGLVDIYHHVGTDAQTVDTNAQANIGPWGANHRLRGVAYSYVRLKYDPEVFAKIPVISAEIDGLLVYDPRDATTKFSNNPALCIYDYMTDQRYGRGIDPADIDTASISAAANACDVVEASYTAGPTQARYTCDGVINIDQPSLDNLRALLTSCRAYMIHTGGKYRLIVDQATASSMAFDDSNIVGGFRLAFDSKQTRYNRVRARFINDAREYQPDIVIEDSSSYRTADNGTLLEKVIDLPFTADHYRARKIAQIELKQSRATQVIEFRATLDGLRAECGDVITVTAPTLSYLNKKFRVLQVALDTQETVKISAREYDTVYTPSSLPQQAVAPSLNFPTVTDVTTEVVTEVEPDTSYIYSFESGDVSGWALYDGTIVPDADACVGTLAGLVTHGGGGNVRDVTLVLPPSFAANVLRTTDNQIRINFWAKQPASNAAAGLKVRLVGSTQNSGWQTFTTSASCQSFGFVWKPTAAQTTLRIDIQGDSNDAGTAATLIDNIVVFALPDFIDAANIGNWMGTLAVGNAYIANGAITTAKIANLQVTNAKIGNAAITNAKIGTAAVDTLTLAGQAVTLPQSAYTSGSVSILTSWVTMQSLTHTNTGAGSPWPVFITCCARVNRPDTSNFPTGDIQVLRGGTVIWGPASITVERDASTIYTVNLRDAPSAGSYTYYYQVRSNSGNAGTATHRSMMVLGAKR